MRKIIYIFFFFGFFANAYGQSVPPKIEKEIRASLDGQLKAINEGNFDEFMSYFWLSDSLTFAVSEGVTVGFQDLKSYQSTGFKERKGKLAYQVVSMKPITETAIFLIGKIEVEMPEKEKNFSYHFSCIMEKKEKKDKKWLITSETISIDAKKK